MSHEDESSTVIYSAELYENGKDDVVYPLPIFYGDDIDPNDMQVVWRKDQIYIDNFEQQADSADSIAVVSVYDHILFVCIFTVIWGLCGYIAFKRYSARYSNRPIMRRRRRTPADRNRHIPRRARLLAALKRMEKELGGAMKQYDYKKLYDVSVSVDFREDGTEDGIILTKKYQFRCIKGRMVRNMKNIFIARFNAINVILESVEMVEKKPDTNIPK